ncbi:MAG: hypothetical protein ABFD85_16170 [Phycisphaerae bacterium]
MSGHTPGPWVYKGFVVDSDFSGWRVYLPTKYRRVIDVEGTSAAEADANARLIAAAPDLLAALKAVVAFTGAHGGPYADARAAITKAEGKQ